MLVYMLFNTVTEMAYVGATDKALKERWERHLKDSRSGTSRLQVALREWPAEVWMQVVLTNCYDLAELTAAEEAWIEATHAREPAVGYNDNQVPYAVSVANGQKGGDPSKAKPAKGAGRSSPLAGMTEEERREWFRQQGKKGAAAGGRGARPRSEMTEAEREKYREWGRKGAQRSKELSQQSR